GDIFVSIEDDGAGLDSERILAKARARGLVAAGATPTEAEIQRMIFLPGFSTAAVITDVSGRGVGLDVVEKVILALGGDVQISSTRGRGPCIVLRLPLTLAIVDGQLIRFGGVTWIVPLPTIVECVPFDPAQHLVVAGKERLYRLRDEILPLVDPCVLFEMPQQ